MKQTLDISLEIKALGDRQFEGHGSTFGNIDLGGDVVMPGAFERSLADHKAKGSLPQMFWMHDPSQVPGKWLDMAEDEAGLKVKGVLANTALGNEMHTLLGMKAVRGLSIGFQTVDAEFDKEGVRRLKEIDLWEVSLVSLAMNPLAEIEAVKARLSAAGEYVPTKREFEDWLHKDLRCSKKIACGLASRVFDMDAGGSPGSHRRESGGVDSEMDAVREIAEHVAERMLIASLQR